MCISNLYKRRELVKILSTEQIYITMSAPVFPSRTWSDYKQFKNGFLPGKPTFKEDHYPSLKGKVVLITGGNSGVGYETVKSLAGSTKAKIYIFSRNEKKTLAAIRQIRQEVAQEYNVTNPDINFIRMDLSDLDTIKPAVDQFLSQEARLDIIIHNAGVMKRPIGPKTRQGYELQLGTNVVGPHLLQRLLDPILIDTSKMNHPGESRIVWISSTAHHFAPLGGVHWDDINFDHTKIGKLYNVMGYGQSKACNIMQARTWSRKHSAGSQIICSSVCPGFLNTQLARNSSCIERAIFSVILHPRRLGAYTVLYAAFSPEVEDGSFSVSFGVPSQPRKDLTQDDACDKLWDFLTKATDPYM
ncbi:uncharacterized protein SPAPADRAFT_152327 [Spathaspora passalidarum NRRL Y-27907]|uniref:Uncharacterized protein n=1 Tax=Spathaspora passalidarum (strain NRRL Y-27907 / 11-Y1) TaxID=619300 RepID=G3ANR7_SPAPN|nr:uncharacterized protein SPAPADRAFT_152327 [Spathaspora passalidarum NRRL Y-27907]EGW32002.1 hypothetical protein SPAPADRAFT_152327 [Spathaspora passalidarum NRRL Y-27907]